MIPNRPHSMKRYSPIERPAELSAPLVKAEMKMFRYLFPWKKTNMVPDMQNKKMLKAGVFRNCINTKDAVPLIFDIHVLHMFCHATNIRPPGFFNNRNWKLNNFPSFKKTPETFTDRYWRSLGRPVERHLQSWIPRGSQLLATLTPCTNTNLSQLQPESLRWNLKMMISKEKWISWFCGVLCLNFRTCTHLN